MSFLLRFLEPESAFIFGCSAFPLPCNERIKWDGLAHLIPSLLVAPGLLGLVVGKIPFSSTQEGVLSEASWYFRPQSSTDNSQHPPCPFPSTTASFLLPVALTSSLPSSSSPSQDLHPWPRRAVTVTCRSRLRICQLISPNLDVPAYLYTTWLNFEKVLVEAT